jgi:hypothetical protein
LTRTPSSTCCFVDGKSLETSTIPISAGLLVDVDAYFGSLGDFRQGNVEPIIEQMADAAFTAITNATDMLSDLDAIAGEWRDRITARSDGTLWRLAELLMRQPGVQSTLSKKHLESRGRGIGRRVPTLLHDLQPAPYGPGHHALDWRAVDCCTNPADGHLPGMGDLPGLLGVFEEIPVVAGVVLGHQIGSEVDAHSFLLDSKRGLGCCSPSTASDLVKQECLRWLSGG